MNSNDPAGVAASDLTVSDKIRALDRLGYPRAEIARLLGKRYQHVRHAFLEGDKLAPHPQVGVTETGRPFDAPPTETRTSHVQPRNGSAFRLVIRSDGSVYLPEDVLEAWRLGPGGTVMASFDGENLVLVDGATSSRRALAVAQGWNLAKDGDLVSELLAERRSEAEPILSVVLDASALLALLQGEPGAAAVVDALPNASISTVNYAEVLTKLI